MLKPTEKDIEEIISITGLSKAKAEKAFADIAKDLADDEEVTIEDIIYNLKIEYQNKSVKHTYTQSDKPKTKAKREIKLDNVKVDFLNEVKVLLDGMALNGKIDNIKIANPQKELTFTIGEDTYSLNLVKHRQPKK